MALKGSLAQENTGQTKDILGTENLDPSTNLLEGERGRSKGLKSTGYVQVPEVATVTQGVVPSSYERILGEGNYHPDFGYTYNQELLHAKQPVTSVMANSLFRFGAEVLSTAGQTLAYDSDLNMGAQLSVDTERGFGNMASQIFESIRDKAEGIAPIYVDPYKEGKFDPGSASWWGENFVSVGSSIGMVAPAALLAAATGGMGAAAGLSKSMVGSNAFKGITTALWSRHAENLMESSGVYKQAFNEALTKGISEKDAKSIASNAAANTYKKQWALLVQDIPQYILLNKLGSFAKGGVAAEKAALQELAPSVQKYLGYGTLNTTAKRVGAVAKDMVGEAGEEIYQFLINEQSNLMARNAADPDHNVKHSMMDVLRANYDNGEMWTAGFWGAAGAGVMQASMSGINRNIHEAVNKAQLDTVTSLGPLLKQAGVEYGAALDSNDPLLAERAIPSFVAAIGMKAKLTNTTAAVKDMLTKIKDSKEGEGFEQWGIDPETQGRLKKDPAFFEQVIKGIDEIGKLYDSYLIETTNNKSIAEKDKGPKAQVMANTDYILRETRKNANKLESAIEQSWGQIRDVEMLSLPGQQAERLKQKKLATQRTLDTFKKRQDETKDTASEEEKTQIDLIIAKAEKDLSDYSNQIDELIGNKEKKIKGVRTAAEAKADKEIVLPQEQIDEFIKQSGRLNAANASIVQLEEMMKELRTSKPLSETIADNIKKELGLDKPQKDTVDDDNEIDFEDIVEFEDETTKEPVKGKIVGVQEAEEGSETDTTSYVIETEDGSTVVKTKEDIHKTEDEVPLDATTDGLTEADEAQLKRPTQVEESEDDGKFHNFNKLSYSQWDDVIKQHVNRDPAVAKALSDKATSFSGSEAVYTLNTNDANTKEILQSLIGTGVYNKGTLKIVVNDKQRQVLKRVLEGKKLTKAEIYILIEEGDTSYTSFIDQFPISVELNLNGVTYSNGLYIHGSTFVPYSSIPTKVKTSGKSLEEKKKSINDYKQKEYKKSRKLRRDLISIILQGGRVRTTKLDRSKGVPNSASKTVPVKQRNKNVAEAFGMKSDDIKLAINKSTNIHPELTTTYLSASDPIKGTQLSMHGSGSIYAYLAKEGLNGENGLIKLNKGKFSLGMAGLVLDAFYLIAQGKKERRYIKGGKKGEKKKAPHEHQINFSSIEHGDIKNIADVKGISAGEFLDLFVVHGKKLTDPKDPRFKKRFGHDASFSKLMENKRLYLHLDGKIAILLYGADENGKPYQINLNQPGVAFDNTDLNLKRDHFMKWLIDSKRIATHLSDPKNSLGRSGLTLNGDFLDSRGFSITVKEADEKGKQVIKTYIRKKGQSYSSFLIDNNFVVTDVTRNESGSLFRDPVVNLNLVNSKGNLNVISNVEPLPIIDDKVPQNDNIVTNDDLKNKADASHSDTKEEKEDNKSTNKKPETTTYKNSFTEKKDRQFLNLEADEIPTDNNVINTLSRGIEELIGEHDTEGEIINWAETTLRNFNVQFGRGSKINTNISGYISNRFAGKTNRTLREEWDAAVSGADSTSSTSTKSTGTPVEPAASNIKTEKPVTNVPKTSMKDLFKISNNTNEEEPPFARSFTDKKSYKSYTDEIRQKEINWAFEVVGIDKEDWRLKNRITDLLYKGKKNFALYSHSAILLYEASEIGTVYHEAFHRVSLGYLTPEERKRFYHTAKLAYKLDSKITDRQVEEFLAEKFRSFILSDGKRQAPGNVQRFFDWIYKGIKSLFYGKRRLAESEIEQLFKQIRNGKYKNSSVLEVNKDSLGDDLYARTVMKGITFDEINNRTDFQTIINSLANTLLKSNRVEDLNDVDKINYNTLIKKLEFLRDEYKKHSEYEGNSEEDRLLAQHLSEMYDELLGTKGENDIYDTFSYIVRPAIDSFLLSIGIKQIGINEDDFVGRDTEDIESIGKLGGDYNKASYERNKKDTALPAIKFMVATLSAESELAKDETGSLIRVPKVNPITQLYTPVNFNLVWSKLFHSLHHLGSIEEMVDELKVIAGMDNYSPFAELAEKLDNASENTRQQFYRILACHQHDFIYVSFQRSNAGYNFKLNRSAEKSAENDTTRRWNNNFFGDPDITTQSAEQDMLLDENEEPVLVNGKPVGDPNKPITYFKKYKADFFEKREEEYGELSNDIVDANKRTKTRRDGKLVDLIPKVIDFLYKYGIEVDEPTIMKTLSNIVSETLEDDLDKLEYWFLNELNALVDSKAADKAKEGLKMERSKDGFFKIGVVRNLAENFIYVHPELKSDIQIGPGNGDHIRKHRYSIHADDNHATNVVKWIKNRAGYVEERLTNSWTKSSRILNRMVPKDTSDNDQVEAAKKARDEFKLVTFSYLKEESSDDRGRGYLNITEREDYLVKFYMLAHNSLLPFPILAQRKTYFFMEGAPIFKDTITDYDQKTKTLSFSKEVKDYFWSSYKDEVERMNNAKALLAKYKTAKGEEKEKIKTELIANYHYKGQYDIEKANAIKLIRFRGFDENVTEFNDKVRAKFEKKLNETLNKRIVNELKYANKLNVISFDSEEGGYLPGLINQSAFSTYESDREGDTDYGIRATIGEYTINTIMSIMESEKIFMGDPALFSTNKNSGEVVEDLYKRYYGLGSTGESYAETIEGDTDTSYTASTIATQTFKSDFYGMLFDVHKKLWKEYYDEKDKDNAGNEEKARKMAENNLKGYENVDATDGGAIISPTMFKKMLKRSGAFPKKVQRAFELLLSDKELSKQEEIEALNIVLNPQKTVYFGQHSHSGVDRTIYDKMAMSVIFPRLVKGTHMEQVLDRMELTGEFALENQLRFLEGGEVLKRIDVLNYDTSIKIGLGPTSDLYKNKNERSELTDLSNLHTEPRYWRNLKQQQSTDAHDVASKQMVGTQVYKITSSNIIMGEPYGEFSSGRELLNSLTKSRISVSNTGIHKVEAELGIRNGIIDNASIISMLRKDAVKSKKSDDFRSALRLDDQGRQYLELDSFPDRNWMYSRLMHLVTSNTIDLNLPGSQLVQVSDYGYSSKGLEKEFKSELKFYQAEFDDKGNPITMIDMECRIPIRAFRRLIPNYSKLTHAERVAALPKTMRLLGYRIPTQGQNSVVNMTVVDYLPDQAGEIIHLPLEFTTLTGSDFDIDKMFTMMLNYQMRNGKIEEVKFIDGNGKLDVQNRYDEKLKELYKIYRRDHTVFNENISDELKKVKKSDELDKQISYATAADNMEAKEAEERIKANELLLNRSDLDDITRKNVESDLSTDRAILDEINDKTVVDIYRDEVWKLQRPIILKTLLSANKIQTLDEFGNLSIEEQNTGEANENRIFKIFQTVLADKKHMRNTTLPLGTLTGKLKSRANRYINAKSGGKLTPLEAFESETPSYQSSLKFKFMTSTQGIGVFALQNSNHALTQQAELRMRTAFKYTYFDGEKRRVLNKNKSVPLDLIEGRDLYYITDWLSAMLDAHVDAVKDNYIAELNVNSATYSVTSLLLRLGYGVSTFDFLSQPAIVELAKEFYSLDGGRHSISEEEEYDNTKTLTKAYKRVKRKLISSLNKDPEEYDNLEIDLKLEGLDVPFEELMKDEKKLIDNMNPSLNKTHGHYKEQLNFLEYFMKMVKDAEKLNSLVLNTRIDTKSFGSNPVEFRHSMNKIKSIEELDKKPENRTFINLDRYLNSRGEYMEDGTMLSPLLTNSIKYLGKIFNSKSIVGSLGFDRMFWGIMDSIPNSENFRMSVINSMTGEMFGNMVAQFYSDPAYKVGMTKEGLHKLFIDNQESVFANLHEVRSRKFKYYEELKDNKILSMLQIDSKPGTAVENFITTMFRSYSDSFDTDEVLADFKVLLDHEDKTVRELGFQLYVYAFYSTGLKNRYYDYLRYIPTSANKEIVTPTGEIARFDDFIKQRLSQLNDPSTIAEFYLDIKKDFFENNWYNWRYVPKAGDNARQPIRYKDGTIKYVPVEFGRSSQYALGINEDGITLYPSYITITGDDSIAQYNVPRSAGELSDEEEMSGETAGQVSDIIGGDVGLFKLVGVSKTLDEDNKLNEFAIYIPVNKKGSLSNGIVTTEVGIKSDTSFIRYNNLLKQIPEEKRISSIKKEVPGFIEVPFDKQQVTNRISRSLSDELDEQYYDENIDAEMYGGVSEIKNRKVEIDESLNKPIIDVKIKDQFKVTEEDIKKGKDIEEKEC